MWHINDHRLKFLDLYDAYKADLGESVDYSLLQSRFLYFLKSERALKLIGADDKRSWPGIQHVIVDEYQDTNPIQKQFTLRSLNQGRLSWLSVTMTNPCTDSEELRLMQCWAFQIGALSPSWCECGLRCFEGNTL